MADTLQTITPESQEAAHREAATKMLNATFDAFDSLAAITQVKAKGSTDEELLQAAEKLQYALSALAVVADGESVSVTLRPRSVRNEDKVKPLPGEHAGVSAQFVSKEGVTTRLNFYGGLRDARSASDQHDSDISLRHSHASRTLTVASQPTHINLHMISPGETQPFFDLWIVRQPTQLSLSTFEFEHVKHDIHPVITSKDHLFKPLTSQLHSAMKNLMLMVPNPYSPR